MNSPTNQTEPFVTVVQFMENKVQLKAPGEEGHKLYTLAVPVPNVVAGVTYTATVNLVKDDAVELEDIVLNTQGLKVDEFNFNNMERVLYYFRAWVRLFFNMDAAVDDYYLGAVDRLWYKSFKWLTLSDADAMNNNTRKNLEPPFDGKMVVFAFQYLLINCPGSVFINDARLENEVEHTGNSLEVLQMFNMFNHVGRNRPLDHRDLPHLKPGAIADSFAPWQRSGRDWILRHEYFFPARRVDIRMLESDKSDAWWTRLKDADIPLYVFSRSKRVDPAVTRQLLGLKEKHGKVFTRPIKYISSLDEVTATRDKVSIFIVRPRFTSFKSLQEMMKNCTAVPGALVNLIVSARKTCINSEVWTERLTVMEYCAGIGLLDGWKSNQKPPNLVNIPATVDLDEHGQTVQRCIARSDVSIKQQALLGLLNNTLPEEEAQKMRPALTNEKAFTQICYMYDSPVSAQEKHVLRLLATEEVVLLSTALCDKANRRGMGMLNGFTESSQTKRIKLSS